MAMSYLQFQWVRRLGGNKFEGEYQSDLLHINPNITSSKAATIVMFVSEREETTARYQYTNVFH